MMYEDLLKRLRYQLVDGWNQEQIRTAAADAIVELQTQIHLEKTKNVALRNDLRSVSDLYRNAITSNLLPTSDANRELRLESPSAQTAPGDPA